MTMTNSIIPIILDAFDAHASRLDSDSPIAIRDMILDQTLTIARCDAFDDCAILHLDLDDELHEITLIAIYDRADLELRSLTLHSDCDISPIALRDAPSSDMIES